MGHNGVDDMLAKSKEGFDHPRDLERVFIRMRFLNVRLNPSKCTFGVQSEKFWGFMVSQMRIEVNLEKLAIENIRSSPCQKEV